MNINLTDGSGMHPMEPDDCDLQGDIEEHIEILVGTGLSVGQPVMLLSDPEYPGAYRVWTTLLPLRRGQDPTWVWVDPEGEVIQTQRPWAVEA